MFHIQAISTAVTPEISKTNGRGSIGLPIARRIDKVTIDKGENIFQALQIGADETSRLISSTWAAFQVALSNGFAGSCSCFLKLKLITTLYVFFNLYLTVFNMIIY